MTEHLKLSPVSSTIDLPAGRFHYLTWGVERHELPSLILLHGITSSAASWSHVALALADRYRVYALDLRGHGESARPAAGAYSLRRTADDVVAFIKALALTDAVLLGHSWGGATAIMLATGAGSEQVAPRFSQVILEDPALHFGRGNLEELVAYYTRDIGRPAAELRAATVVENPSWSVEDVEGKVTALQQVSREAVTSILTEARQDGGNLLPFVLKMPAPTLLIRADPTLGSIIDTTTWEEIRRAFTPPSATVQIDGSTHNIHRTSLAQFMQAVNNFLKTEQA